LGPVLQEPQRRRRVAVEVGERLARQLRGARGVVRVAAAGEHDAVDPLPHPVRQRANPLVVSTRQLAQVARERVGLSHHHLRTDHHILGTDRRAGHERPCTERTAST
jgi:hypothetical protein